MDITRDPVLEEAYEVCQAIEECSASDELTNAVTKASDLTKSIDKLLDERDDLYVFLRKLYFGGSIVPSSECSEMEIIQAQACGRFLAVDSLGYVFRPPANADNLSGSNK